MTKTRKQAQPQSAAADEVANIIFNCAISNKRVVAVTVTPGHVRSQDTDWFVAACEAMPQGAVLLLNITGYEDDPREVWQVPELRAFFQEALTAAPHILSRFAEMNRKLIRLCFHDVSNAAINGDVISISYAVSPEWVRIAATAGVDPRE